MSRTTLRLPPEWTVTHDAEFRISAGTASLDHPTPPPQVGRVASASVARKLDRFSAMLLPIALSASLFAPIPPTGRRYRVETMTTMRDVFDGDFASEEASLVYAPELVRPEHIAHLESLLSLPLVPELGLEFGDTD